MSDEVQKTASKIHSSFTTNEGAPADVKAFQEGLHKYGRANKNLDIFGSDPNLKGLKQFQHQLTVVVDEAYEGSVVEITTRMEITARLEAEADLFANVFLKRTSQALGLKRGVKVERAPGFGTRDFLGHFCQKNFRERVLEPLHAEALVDYQDALAKKDFSRAKHVRYMIYFWMLTTMLKGALSWVTGKLSFKVGTSGD